jgi:hypothetical protein
MSRVGHVVRHSSWDASVSELVDVRERADQVCDTLGFAVRNDMRQ